MNGFEVTSAMGPSRKEIERERGWTLGERIAEAGRTMRCGSQLARCYFTEKGFQPAQDQIFKDIYETDELSVIPR